MVSSLFLALLRATPAACLSQCLFRKGLLKPFAQLLTEEEDVTASAESLQRSQKELGAHVQLGLDF